MYHIDFSHPSSVYFVGIGGVSMSALAELLADAGFQVSGSDRSPSALTRDLESKGIKVFYGQRAENITDSIDCVVFTSAIAPDNPEYTAAHEKNLPCLTRGQLMGQIMLNYELPIGISGTHGKTTTTSMAGEILLHAGLDPTLAVGGILKDIGGNMRIGKSGYFMTEACEYTNTFLDFHPRVGIILNIGEDHLDFFKDLADIRNSFRNYARLLPRDGCLIINGQIDNLTEITEGLACRVITFGSNASSGEHNVYNAMAAIALADLLEVDTEITAKALRAYRGTDRRFEHKGSIGGVNIIDDYAHHPDEITATLKAAANYPHRKIWCVFQPHTYSRTKAFLKDFARSLALADAVVLTDIYAARENYDPEVSSRLLQQEIQALGKECHYFPTFDEVENFLLENCIKGDMLITMGAGDVVKIGENLLGK